MIWVSESLLVRDGLYAAWPPPAGHPDVPAVVLPVRNDAGSEPGRLKDLLKRREHGVLHGLLERAYRVLRVLGGRPGHDYAVLPQAEMESAALAERVMSPEPGCRQFPGDRVGEIAPRLLARL